MDLSRVGEKILSSVKAATSLGLIPSASAPDRPEVPAQAAAVALVTRALAGLPPQQRFNLPSSSSELSSIYGSRPAGQPALDLEEFYEENGRRHLTSSMKEVSRVLIVNSISKKEQALLDMLPVLRELLHARDMHMTLESLVELLDGYSELSAIKEMGRGVEPFCGVNVIIGLAGKYFSEVGFTVVGVCKEFKPESYITDNEVDKQSSRSMDKYARLMQKLEIVNVEFFKGICQLFEIFFHFVFRTFCQNTANLSGKGINDSPNYRLKTALSRIAQDCDQWIKLQIVSLSSSSPTFLNDVTPTGPNISVLSAASLGLKVESVPNLSELIHRMTARLLLHTNGCLFIQLRSIENWYADRIANAKWDVKELGLEHNGFVLFWIQPSMILDTSHFEIIDG